jgi:hypothetical protein
LKQHSFSCLEQIHKKKCTKREIFLGEMDAVQRALEQLTAPEVDESVDENERMVRFAALMKRAGD